MSFLYYTRNHLCRYQWVKPLVGAVPNVFLAPEGRHRAGGGGCAAPPGLKTRGVPPSQGFHPLVSTQVRHWLSLASTAIGDTLENRSFLLQSPHTTLLP